jgi:transcriptional regulator with XRE-family HTH domain
MDKEPTMSDKPLVAAELGKYLSEIRERAGIKQAELARRITWSPAVLSRVESGDRTLADEELDAILNAIDTPEAARLRATLLRQWHVLPRPALDHPDQDLLWSAEEVAQQIVALREKPDLPNAFERRLSEYVSELSNACAFLMKREHQVAFIGSIGIGKSTAICRIAGLEVGSADSGRAHPVLEAGAGGVTICEVHVRSGPGFGILIEPRREEEIRADVMDFAEYILGANSAATEADTGGESESGGISKEIERAIRNLAKLKVRREKTADGKVVRQDDARELAKQHPSVRELAVEILSRMELHRRDRRDIWFDQTTGKAQLQWLKETFEKINNGRHEDFTLPKRIEVVVPHRLLDADDLTIRFIDTRGIDRTATRADLEAHLDEPHTLTVLCSGFNNAPAAEARLLLERAREAGVRSLLERAALLVFPRPNEALAVKDESGVTVDSADDGYQLKAEQVSMNLQQLGLESLATHFFNAYEDDPNRLRIFLKSRLEHARAAFRASLSAICESARLLLVNVEKEQTQAVLRQTALMLDAWTSQHQTVPQRVAHVQDSLLGEMGNVYASTVRAAVRREGEWHNLNYPHHLGYGARRLAALALERSVEGFSELCSTMSANPEYAEAKDLLAQADRVLQSAFDDLLRKIQLMGQTVFRDTLKRDSEFWQQCEAEWGRGPGYKGRVAEHNRTWFESDERRNLESELSGMIQREWAAALQRVGALSAAS